MHIPAIDRTSTFKLLIGLYLPAGLILLAVYLVSVHTDTPVWMFTRDPADITHSSPFIGIVSNICILLWCATAAICFFACVALRNKAHEKMALFFLLSGLITSLLLLDDLFLLHERIFPQYFHWRQRYIYVSYVSIVLAYLVSFRKIIFENNFFILALALSFFFLSVVVDCISAKMGEALPYFHLYEDGFKLFGLASWLGFYGLTALRALLQPDNLRIK